MCYLYFQCDEISESGLYGFYWDQTKDNVWDWDEERYVCVFFVIVTCISNSLTIAIVTYDGANEEIHWGIFRLI